MVEIQKIAYSSEKDRTPKSVLRIHNMSWYHGILCREVFGFKLKEITTRKLYGNYFHDITSHASMQHRLVCGKSCNVEEQERVFNAIANITKSTSSYHPNHIISNVFIRLQAEKHMSAYKSNCVSTQEAAVSKLAASLPPYGNTIIPHHLITKHSRSWQSHLERISDFLLISNQVWWEECENGDIEFYDGEQCLCPNSHPQGPALHHFRSSSFIAEEKYLENCWKECLSRGIVLPTKVLRVENEKGNMEIRHLNSSIEANVDDNAVDIEPEDAEPEDAEPEDAVPEDAATETVISFQLVTNNYELPSTSPELDGDCVDIMPVNDAFQNEVQNDSNTVELELTCHQNVAVESSSKNSNDNTPAPEDHTPINEKVSVNNSTNSCVTKMGQNVEFVLGNTKEVLQFDKSRRRLKQWPTNKDYMESYNDNLAIIETRISSQQGKLKHELELWEREFFVKNNCNTASYADIIACPTAKLLRDRLKYSRALLKNFRETNNKYSQSSNLKVHMNTLSLYYH